MKIIAGLGNPGLQYAKTKHNVGFMLLDALAQHLGASPWKEAFTSLISEVRIVGEKIFLVKPQTYMNESGSAIGPMLAYYKVGLEDLVVVHDDMDIPAGMIRIRKKGGSGGHNGIKSIIAHVGGEKFPRIRIGIGRPMPGWSVIDHVLAPFSSEDIPRIHTAIEMLLPAVSTIVTDGVDLAMNRYNPQKRKSERQREKHEAQQTEGKATDLPV